MSAKLIPYGETVFFDYHDGMAIICKEHMMKVDELTESDGYVIGRRNETKKVECIEGPHTIILDKFPSDIRKLFSRRINSKQYQDAEYFDIDGYLVPASKEVQAKTKDSTEYFVTAQVKKSEKKGEQVVVYAGKKGLKGKSQIFIDPTNGKMTFDQNDINPSDIFVELKATFRDGSTTTIAKPLQ